MSIDPFADALAGPWALVTMCMLVFGDAFLVVIPGEIAVTALGAVSVASGAPPLWVVVSCAAAAAVAGDTACYLLGRLVGTERWAWMRRPRIQRSFDWAGRRLDGGMATVLFTARFIPFARLAVNLVAGASRLRPPRYLALVSIAALGWAAYQAAIGAAVAAIVPGGLWVAVPVSVAIAIGLGVIIDFVMRRARPDLPDDAPVP